MAGKGSNYPILRTAATAGSAILGFLTGNPGLARSVHSLAGRGLDAYSARRGHGQPPQQGTNVPGVQMREIPGRPGLVNFNQGISPREMPQLNSFLAGSQYGPYARGYEFPSQPPMFDTGLPDNNVGYASLPNYGSAGGDRRPSSRPVGSGLGYGGLGGRRGANRATLSRNPYLQSF